MFVLVRTIVYATLFIGLVLIYVPASLLSQSGVTGPTTLGLPQVAGMIVGAVGAVIALWCIFTFPTKGKGTPAPFDPPRRLVTVGPYRFVRNPMYIGAVVALAGASLFYESVPILIYTVVFFLAMHLFVLWYEEPTLRSSFPNEYEAYCGRVRRWLPGI
jgi:protein-S-isoprenylcysteine O-methyltransferase Ste14